MSVFSSEVLDASAVGDVAEVHTASKLRRVASAPAFKHASAYHGPCGVLAEAQAQAQAEAAAVVSSPAPAGNAAQPALPQGNKRSRLFSGWGKHSSNKHPAKPSSSCSTCPRGRCNCLEVYVVSRAFTEFGGDFIRNLPDEVRQHTIDIGLCHYMTVFKAPDGRLVQFDFGPRGGDVQKAHGPLATFLRRAHTAALAQAQHQQLVAACSGSSDSSSDSSRAKGMMQSPSMPMLPLASVDLAGDAGAQVSAALAGKAPVPRRKKGVAGEIRERTLNELPSACMYMGRTNLSLADIRRYNSLQDNLWYTLHDNDCRHYVNSLVHYTTGVERSTQHLKRHYFNSRYVDKWIWYGWFITATQFVTDVGNWGHVQAGAAATLLAVTGRSTIAQLKTLAAPAIPALSKALPSLIPSATPAVAGKVATMAATSAGSSIVGSLTTTLKLPAALLLKRPLALTAAGGAGAAAAAIRTAPVASADANTGNSHGSSFGGFGAWARPLKQWRDGLGRGVHGAVLSLRRSAVGVRGVHAAPHAASHEATAAEAPPGGGRPSADAAAGSIGSSARPLRAGWFGVSNANRQQAMQAAGSGTIAAAVPVGALPSASADHRRWSSGSGSKRGSSSGDEQQAVPRGRERGNFLLGLGQQVGRHMKWLGSTAATATGTIAVIASRQVGLLVGARNSAGAAAAASLGGSCTMAHNSAAFNLLRNQTEHPLQQQQQRSLMGQRSRSAPSLAVVAAAAAVATGNAAPGGVAAPATIDAGTVSADMLDDADVLIGMGSSSLTSSSVGSKTSGVGRQVLNLPAPRIAWGKRVSHAIVGQ